VSSEAERTLAEKLDELFSTVHPIGKEYSYNDVARGVEELGAPRVSATYIWQLRTGKRDNPTKRHIEALASFFGVPPAYFFDDQVAAQVRSQLQLLATLRDHGVRQVATRAAGLSPRALRAVDEMIKQVRQLEGLGDGADVDNDAAGGNVDPHNHQA
jgi:transcriptional regulator with XRE-family HTH domain